MDVVSAKPQRTAVAGGRRSSPPAPAVLAVTCVATLIALMNYTAPMTVLTPPLSPARRPWTATTYSCRPPPSTR